MKKTVFSIVLILSAILFHQCTEDTEIGARPFTRVSTLPVENINEEGATFKGTLLYDNKDQITSYGFVWGTNAQNLSIDNSERVIYANQLMGQDFEATINSTLNDGFNYYVKAFVQTDKYLIYGEAIYFESKGSKGPEVLRFEPHIVAPKDTFLIYGKSFSYLLDENKVLVNKIMAPVLESTDSTLKVVVPWQVRQQESDVMVIVGDNRPVQSDLKLLMLAPVITDFYPKTVGLNSFVTIEGRNFSKDRPHVWINSESVQIISATDTKIVFKTPRVMSDREYTIEVTGNYLHAQSSEKLHRKPPAIIDFYPKEGRLHSLITLLVTDPEPFDWSSGILFHNSDSYYSEQRYGENVDTIRVRVPGALPELSKIRLKSRNYDIFSEEDFKFIQPEIHSITPGKGTTYSEVVIKGDNFGYYKELDHNITVQGLEASIVKVNKDSVVFRIPMEVSEQHVPINVTIANKAFPTYDFEISGGIWNKTELPFTYDGKEIYQIFTIESKTYYLKNNSELWEHDMINNTITHKTDLEDFNLYRYISFTENGKGYIANGFSSSRHGPNPIVFEYDPVSDSWQRFYSFEAPKLSETTHFEFEGENYFAFGADDDRISNRVYKFNSLDKDWELHDEYPGSSEGLNLSFTLNNEVYFISSYRPFKFIKYNPVSKIWTELNNVPIPNEDWYEIYPPFVQDNEVYIPVEDLWKYNPENDTWEIFSGPSEYLSFSDDNYLKMAKPIYYDNRVFLPKYKYHWGIFNYYEFEPFN